jgi:hypothetical protein
MRDDLTRGRASTTRRLTAAAASTLAASAIFACSLLTSVDGLTGGADDGAAPRADGATDAASDVLAADGGADATTEGGATMCPPYVLPASCDSKYLSDDKNCCVAGRDCHGGGCVAGKCQPVTVSSQATGDARGIALSNSTLLWATGCTGVVRRIQTDGTAESALPAGPHCTPTLALSGANVYWVEFDGPNLMRTAIDGTTGAKIVAVNPLAGARATFGRLTTDATRAYWASDSPGSVWFSPLDGDHATPTALAADPDAGLGVLEPATNPYGIAVDATHVYWSDRTAGVVKRRALASLGANMAAEVGAIDQKPGDLALDATRVYWVTGNGFVRSHAKDGSGDVLTLASGESEAETILVDDQYVYWARHELGSPVKRVPKNGSGAQETLATNQKAPWELTQDCTTIYWTNHNNFGTGEIMKVTK